MRALQEKDRQIQELDSEKNEEIGRLRQDLSDQNSQLNHLNHLVNKLKSEISEKDSMLGRTYNDNDHELQALRSQV